MSDGILAASPILDPGAEVPSSLRVDLHRKAVDQTRDGRERLARAYRSLAKQWHARAGAAEREARNIDVKLAQTEGAIESALAWDEPGRAALLAAGAIGEERERDRLVRLAAEHQAEANRYAGAEMAVLACGSGMFVGQAEDGCRRFCVGNCNRVACPLCSPGRASEAVAKWAPRIGDLTDVRVLMLSIRNVPQGSLAAGVDVIKQGMIRLRATRYFKTRWNAGVYSIETTAGRPPREFWPDCPTCGGACRVKLRDRRRGDGHVMPPAGRWWHPHAHVIVGNLDRGPDDVFPDECECSEHPCRHVGEWKAELQDAWTAALRDVNGEAIDYSANTWIDRPFVKSNGRRVYVDDGDREAVAEATREAIKYVTKGVDAIPAGMIPELIVAKESSRWIQSFGKLHGTGERGCLVCIRGSCDRCKGRSWRKKDAGEDCPCCAGASVPYGQVDDPPPWCCSHGHTLRFAGYSAPAWEHWREHAPIGLILPRRTRPTRAGPRVVDGMTSLPLQ